MKEIDQFKKWFSDNYNSMFKTSSYTNDAGTYFYQEAPLAFLKDIEKKLSTIGENKVKEEISTD